MANEAQLLARLTSLEQKVLKIGNEEMPSASAVPISESPEGLFKGMTIPVGATVRLTTIPKGAQVILFPGGDFMLSISPSMAKGSYALGWQLSTGVTGAKPFVIT